MKHEILEQMMAFPLFAELNEEDLAQIAQGLHPATIPAGEYLYVQGQRADSAHFLTSGQVEVLTRLPGGGEVVIAELGAGSMLGEMSLIEAGLRTASVRARLETTALTITRQFFQAAIAQFNVAAFRILRRIMRIMCHRLRDTHENIVRLEVMESNMPGVAAMPPIGHAADAARGVCSFDYRSFLGLLRFFRNFEIEERDALVALMEVMELPRGSALFDEDDQPIACYVIVRGAVEISMTRGGRKFPLMVLGPGEMCGEMALLDERPRSIAATIRERATLLELRREPFRVLLNEESWLALKFQTAICENQVTDMARANRHLARLVSHASIQSQRIIPTVLDVEAAFGTAPDEADLRE